MATLIRHIQELIIIIILGGFNMTKEEIYDEQISPLMRRIIAKTKLPTCVHFRLTPRQA